MIIRALLDEVFYQLEANGYTVEALLMGEGLQKKLGREFAHAARTLLPDPAEMVTTYAGHPVVMASRECIEVVVRQEGFSKIVKVDSRFL